MKVGIYGGVDVGDVIHHDIPYIGVDAGTSHLLKYGIHPFIALGDMDSIQDASVLTQMNIIQVSPIKDDTDTALALEYAFTHGYDEIEMYGVTQKRMDHFMALICLLEKYQEKKIVVYDRYNKIQVLTRGKHYIKKDGYQYFSVFAFDESVISLKECHYPLDCYLLKRQDPLCVSNQMNHEEAIIETTRPILFIQSH